ncbi:MAG: histidinol dehydrogenase, partial [Leucothrix sp.]
MAVTFLKKAEKNATTGEDNTREIVSTMLKEIEAGGEARCEEYAKQLDNYEGNIVVTQEEIEAAGNSLSQQVKDDIRFAYDRVHGFAVKQRESLIDFETELSP